MSWFSKEYEIPFEHRPIAGLVVLDGAVYSRVLERDATIRLKSPGIYFPSGRTYPLVQTEDQQLWLQLFGPFAVPLFSDRDVAFTHLKTLITPTTYAAYFVHPIEDDGVLIWGKTEAEHLLIRYDTALQQVRDIQAVSGTPGAYRIRGQTYYLP